MFAQITRLLVLMLLAWGWMMSKRDPRLLNETSEHAAIRKSTIKAEGGRSKLFREVKASLEQEYSNSERRAIFVPDKCLEVMEDDGITNSHALSNKFNKVYDTSVWGGDKLVLEDFYNNAKWPPAERKAGSGGGSDLGYATETSLRIVNDVIQKYNITTMIDVPCGDANWIFDSAWTDHHLSLYLGLDIAGHPIAQNALRFSHHMNKAFRQWDAAECSLPKYKWSPFEEPSSFQLVHARDVLQHLPLESAVRFVCNIFTSGARVLITTTYFKWAQNKNIEAGDFYANDLFAAPYDFPPGSGVCEKTHPEMDPDLTCIFDLRQDWVEEFVDDKCGGFLV